MMSALGREDESRLAGVDFLGDTGELRARALERVRAARDADPAGVREGADDSGSIRVVVDDRGGVRGVEISDGWRDRLEARRFAEGVFQAYTAAVREAMEAAAIAALTAEPRREPRHTRASQPAGGHGEARQAATWAALHEIEAALRRIRAVEMQPAGRRRGGTVRSPSGLFTLHLSGRAVAGISGDDQLIADAGLEQLRHDALTVLRAVPSMGSR